MRNGGLRGDLAAVARYSIADTDFACSRSTNFWILPVEVLGSTQNSTYFGTL